VGSPCECLSFFSRIENNLVFNTVKILEIKGVVAWRGILRVLLRGAHYGGAYLPDLVMQPVDLGAGSRFKRKMNQII